MPANRPFFPDAKPCQLLLVLNTTLFTECARRCVTCLTGSNSPQILEAYSANTYLSPSVVHFLHPGVHLGLAWPGFVRDEWSCMDTLNPEYLFRQTTAQV